MKRINLILATLCLTVAVLLGSAGVSWSDGFPSSQSSSQCAYGSNGDVSCGGQSSQCAYGSNGSVSCGGQSSQCAYGSNGDVSCGGEAQ